MQRIWDSAGFQSVLAALGRGAVMAAMAYAGFLVKHIHDYETIIGTCLLIFLVPLAGLLHLVVPAIPGVPTSMAARWPRIGRPLALPDPAPSPEPQPVPEPPITGGVAKTMRPVRTPNGQFGHRVVPEPPAVATPAESSD